ncbi:MAG: class I SAM-dependent methyltransferase [Trebonia sp.]
MTALGLASARWRLAVHGKTGDDDLVDYDARMYAVYEAGRALPEYAIANWISVFARFAPQSRPLTVLDLGSGTGRFSAALAGEFGGPVHAVEPSAKMRGAAMARHAHPAVTVLAGAAERIPLPGSSCDLALLFLSWHHVADPERGAAELARVVRPGGTVLLRGAFCDRLPDLGWHRFFPEARAAGQRLLPPLAATTATFARAGFDETALERVTLCRMEPMIDWANRLRQRAISTFEPLTAVQTAAGFARLDAEVAANRGQVDVTEGADLLVLRRRNAP